LHILIVVVVLSIAKPIGKDEVSDIVRRKTCRLLFFAAFGFEFVVEGIATKCFTAFFFGFDVKCENPSGGDS
jgi:chromate transport protein ChrA